MMSITEALRTAARLLGTTLHAMTTEAQVPPEHFGAYLDCLEDVDRLLATRGLRLAIVWMGRPSLDIPDQRVLAATERDHLARGERNVRSRLASMLKVDLRSVERTIDHGAPLAGPDRGALARKRLWDHRIDPERFPLPQSWRRRDRDQLVPGTSSEVPASTEASS
ncbi:hypothetical protein WMF38_57275 [Sorangium sp. So ce118]